MVKHYLNHLYMFHLTRNVKSGSISKLVNIVQFFLPIILILNLGVIEYAI